MTTTFPSRILAIVDIPEPRNLTTKFQYNFFVTDERVNGTGDGVTGGQLTPGNNNANLVNGVAVDLVNDVARYMRISWSPVYVETCGVTGNEFTSEEGNSGATSAAGIDYLNPGNIQLIQDELSFSNFDFVAVNFQDSGLDGKLFSLVSGSAEMRGITNTSTVEAAKILNDLTRATVNGNELLDASNDLQACGILYAEPGAQEPEKRDIYTELRKLSIHTQINNKIVGTMVRSVAEDSLNIFADEMAQSVLTAERLQSAAIERLESTSVNSREWDTGFIPIDTLSVSTDVSSYDVADIQVIGYLLLKEEITPQGNVIDHNPFIVKGKNATAVIDTEIKYGAVYRYRVRAITSLSLLAKDEDGLPIRAIGLVASRPSPTSTISCVDNVPPPAPADFKVSWDYSERAARLTWSFPINRQRDIKYFQIFRRRSMHEPFELLREYDFDDTIGRVDRKETIRDDLIFRMKDPRTFFIDREFDKDSKFIYTLCALDAHGLTSNYSIQFEARFDRFSNKMITRPFSRSGAPKAFPNMFMKNDTFIDTIKTSGFERVRVYFDPEYLRIRDANGEDMGFLPLEDQFAKYKMQIINTDFQTNQIVDFVLDDKRSTTDTSTAPGGSEREEVLTNLNRKLGGLA